MIESIPFSQETALESQTVDLHREQLRPKSPMAAKQRTFFLFSWYFWCGHNNVIPDHGYSPMIAFKGLPPGMVEVDGQRKGGWYSEFGLDTTRRSERELTWRIDSRGYEGSIRRQLAVTEAGVTGLLEVHGGAVDTARSMGDRDLLVAMRATRVLAHQAIAELLRPGQLILPLQPHPAV